MSRICKQPISADRHNAGEGLGAPRASRSWWRRATSLADTEARRTAFREGFSWCPWRLGGASFSDALSEPERPPGEPMPTRAAVPSFSKFNPGSWRDAYRPITERSAFMRGADPPNPCPLSSRRDDTRHDHTRTGPSPAPVCSIAIAIRSRSACVSRRSAAPIQPSTCAAFRAPTIAPVTPGHASVHATATATTVAAVGPRSASARRAARCCARAAATGSSRCRDANPRDPSPRPVRR